MTIVYEDGAIRARVPETGAAAGHVIIEPLQEATYLFDLPEEVVAQLFFCASFTASALFEGLGAQGTNILVNEGEGKLQLHVLPRAFEDDVGLRWDPVRANPADLDQSQKKLSDSLWYVGKEDEAPPPPTVAAPPPAQEGGAVQDYPNPQLHAHRREVTPPEDSYKFKQLRRRM